MQKLFNSQQLEQYLFEGSRHVDGYLQSGSASVIWSIFDIQDELNITGNIAEIGAFHGKLFILLCHSLRSGERGFAIDAFDTKPDIQGLKTEEDLQRFNPKNFHSNLEYNGIDEWDSIGHMSLIAAIEEEYKITFETDDIVDFSSFKKGIELLKKYNVRAENLLE